MGIRILVAEDEFVTAFDLCDTFEEAGYEVEGPHAGIASALHACARARPDVALLDIELVDGLTFDLAQRLIDADVPVILHSEPGEAAELAARFPRAMTLVKPCPPTALLGAVSRVLAPA